jgi:transposase InsO family protein
MQEFSPQAAFRYQVVSQVLTRICSGETQREAVLAVAALEHYFPGDQRARRVSERAIYLWLGHFREQGIAGLETSPRIPSPPPGGSLPPKFFEFIVAVKTQDSRASIPEIIRRAAELGILKPEDAVDRTTVYRAAKRRGLWVAHQRKSKDRDVRRFAYPHRMDMVLCDGKHFRAGMTRARRVAMFFLDDATRLLLHAVVGSSEAALLFQRGLYELILKYGFFTAIYLDRGPAFIAEDTIAVINGLGAILIHGEKAYPQGHGKIEKLNQTARNDVLRGLDRRPDVDPEHRSLELRLEHYADTQYNHRPHESLHKESPFDRFLRDAKELRFPESAEALRETFEVYLTRTVTPDNVVSVDSIFYEMPRGHDGKKVVLRRKLLDGGRLLFLHEGRLIELHPVDLEENARSRRGKGNRDDQEVEHPLPPSAADLAFNRDLGSVVDPDGGCPDPANPHPTEEP